MLSDLAETTTDKGGEERMQGGQQFESFESWTPCIRLSCIAFSKTEKLLTILQQNLGSMDNSNES